MQLEPKKYILIVVLLWVGSVGTSLIWNLFQVKQTAEQEYLKTAKAFVQQILITRAWNASHAGIYLRVSETLRPNPFLQVPERDIETNAGLKLTMVNPAFMTRMISELAQEQGNVKFHMTSLDPINPQNKPTAWERGGLLAFEENQNSSFFKVP